MDESMRFNASVAMVVMVVSTLGSTSSICSPCRTLDFDRDDKESRSRLDAVIKTCQCSAHELASYLRQQGFSTFCRYVRGHLLQLFIDRYKKGRSIASDLACEEPVKECTCNIVQSSVTPLAEMAPQSETLAV